jgi:hypothetical protein
MIKKLEVRIPTFKVDTLLSHKHNNVKKLSYSIEDVRKECTKYLKYTMHKIKVNRATVQAHGCVASCSSLHMGQEILRLNHSRRQCE